MESARLQTVQSQKNRDAEAAALKASLREAQRALAEKVRDGARKSKELEELRSTMDSHLTATERRYGDDAALYRKRSGSQPGTAQH
jgi:soluble cytochrome b562